MSPNRQREREKRRREDGDEDEVYLHEDEDENSGADHQPQPQQSRQNMRVIKRIRQACTNCRQKKIKCSGDRPCTLCTKLSQPCRYHAASTGDRPRRVSSGTNQYDMLPLRVSMIESKLTELIHCVQGSMLKAPNSNAPAHQAPPSLDLDGMAFDESQSSTTSAGKENSPEQAEERSWSMLPPSPVLLAATDVYFRHCQNQPYCYFHEESFRQELAAGTLPEYLIFAFLATAVRFSTDPYFQNKQVEAGDAYASASWKLIVSKQLTQEDGMGLQIVQAANLLAIIDFTASRLRLAWMKIGLAVRIAQDLQLMHEPSPDLTWIEQEERRRVFWSVYLLDKLVSCGKARPPAILNVDCRVSLPCHEQNFRQGLWEQSRTIDKLLNESSELVSQPSTFGLTILMASLLGSCVRYSLHECSAEEDYPPWDSRSEFARIRSSLMCFECYVDSSEGAFAARVAKEFTIDGVVDDQQTGHLVFAHALFHLSHCLLHHPFLLRKRLEKFSRNAPSSFLSTSFGTCVKHAGMLSSVLNEAINANCLVETSFYSYCLTVSSTVHCLFLNSSDESVRQSSSQNLQLTLHMLHNLSRFWNHAALMSTALSNFQSNTSRYSKLVSITAGIDTGLSAVDIEDMWSLVDYGLMSKVAVPAIMHSQVPVTEWSPNTWLNAAESDNGNPFGGTMTLGEESFGGQAFGEQAFGGQAFGGQQEFGSGGFGMVGTGFPEHIVPVGSNFSSTGM